MAKITTAKIKEALRSKIGDYNWSRITKRKFEYKNNVIVLNSMFLTVANIRLVNCTDLKERCLKQKR